VFLFAEYKISIEQVETMLKTFFTENSSGKFSYKEFVENYKKAESL
jgi:Ca2+-binding EF-hand superfamily protein